MNDKLFTTIRDFKCLFSDIQAIFQLELNTCDAKLTKLQADVIVYASEHDNKVLQHDLEKVFNVRPPTMAHMMDTMELKGWIIKKSTPPDNRRKTIFLTPMAKQYLPEIKSTIAKIEQLLFKNLSPAEVDTLKEIVSKMRANVKEYQDAK